jgi:uncharacterized protein (DUF1778 family)
MSTRTSQLQIRVTAAEKETLKRLAQTAGQSLSAYVLSQALPSTDRRFAEALEALADSAADPRGALAALRAVLRDLSAEEMKPALAHPRVRELTPVLQNVVAAVVEQASADKGAEPPAWVQDVLPLDRPHFGWNLQSLRPHQIHLTPAAFKRRNLFFDPASGPGV